MRPAYGIEATDRKSRNTAAGKANLETEPNRFIAAPPN
jgi:hypothetical protein